MKLSETWFMEGYIDFELQKYRLLAYLHEVDQFFNESKLYPQLSDVIFHYNNLNAFKNNKKFLQDQFPQRLDGINIQRLELLYEKMLADDELMLELEQITQYAIDEIKPIITNGTGMYEFFEKQMLIEPVGIIPLYKNEGYMLIRYDQFAEIRAYAYTITLFEHHASKYKGIRIQYIDSWQKNIVNTYENIKRDIIRLFRTLPNPAVYRVESSLSIPLDETLLPIAKRMLVKIVDENKAA